MRPSLAGGSLRGLLSLRWGRPGAETCKRRSRRPSGQLPPEGRPREEFARGGCAHSRVVQEGKSELGPGEGFWVSCVLAFLTGLGGNKAGVCRWAGHQGENRRPHAARSGAAAPATSRNLSPAVPSTVRPFSKSHTFQ